MIPLVKNNIKSLTHLCKTHGVESFYLFGSAAKGTYTKKSDLDFLVKFSKSVNLLDYADNYFDFLEKLKKLFNTNIDLLTESSLKNPILINDINSSKIALYES